MRNLLGLLLVTFIVPAQARQFLDDEEFRKKLDRLNDRYESYFEHEKKARAFEKERDQGGAEMSRIRKMEERQEEAARLEYIKNRKAEPDTAPLEKAWLQRQAKEDEVRERAREQFVKRRDQLEKIEKTARKISPEEEFDISTD